MSGLQELETALRARLAALPRGAATATVRALRREYTRQLAGAPGREVVALALRLMAGPTFTYRFVAYELVHYHRAALASLTARDLERLAEGMDSWYAVDTFGCFLSGPAWREGQVPDALIERWARSSDRWRRRAALVSTVPLNNRARGGRGDAARTLAVCARLVADRDDMVVKALSWALRALIHWEAAAVRAFLREHDADLAPRVKREVNNKLRTGLKSG